MRIGREFADLYRDPAMAASVDRSWLPWVLDGAGPAGDPPVDLGPDVLTVAGGPATALAAARASGELTTADIAELDGGPLPWPDHRFSAVVAVLALHHWSTPAEQDRVLTEWRRVLVPGGTLVGLNPIDGPHFRSLDAAGLCTPVEPLGFPARLAAAGFTDVLVRVWSLVAFTARAPERR